MDIKEPSLMDVAHDTINSTQGPALIEGSQLLTLLVAKEKGRAFFVVIVGGMISMPAVGIKRRSKDHSIH